MAPRNPTVFINVPFDKQYERLYVALIAGIVALGGRPRSTLEIPPTKDRLRASSLSFGPVISLSMTCRESNYRRIRHGVRDSICPLKRDWPPLRFFREGNEIGT